MPVPGRAAVSQALNVGLTAVFIAWSLANLVVYSLAEMVLTITATSRMAPISSGDQSWSQAAREKNERNDAKIPENWRLDPSVIEEAKKKREIAGPFIESLLDDQSRSITALDVPELIKAMSTGDLSAFQVVNAFCKRAAYAHQLNRNLLEIGFDLALSRARELDAFFYKYKKLVGPLHGIPITLKDQFHIKGLETTMAYVGWIGTFEGKKGTGKEKLFESQMIQDLYSLGAIPIGKTSLVMSLWAAETNNNILGYNWNPHNQHLSSGGSSGGEGAMQALRGSAVGFGTDIGGSISVPASFNGVFSMKPSNGRIPFKGVANSLSGQQDIPTVTGILGHSIASIRLVFRSLLSTEPWLRDPGVFPIPWQEKEERQVRDAKYLNFGFMEHDQIVAPHPPVSRALQMVKKALQAQNHKVIPWTQPDNDEAMAIHSALTRGDGCPDVVKALKLSGEPPVPEIEHLFPNGIREKSLELSTHEDFSNRMKKYREEYVEYWNSTAAGADDGKPVDAVILPVTPYAGLVPGNFTYLSYNCFSNVLDYPTVVIPVTFADKTVDFVDPYYKPLNRRDKLNMRLYNPEAHDGAPVGIQILGRRLREEQLIAVAQVVVDALEKYRKNESKL